MSQQTYLTTWVRKCELNKTRKRDVLQAAQNNYLKKIKHRKELAESGISGSWRGAIFQIHPRIWVPISNAIDPPWQMCNNSTGMFMSIKIIIKNSFHRYICPTIYHPHLKHSFSIYHPHIGIHHPHALILYWSFTGIFRSKITRFSFLSKASVPSDGGRDTV